MLRLPPALAARATAQILELLGDPPGHVLELGFAGIHAVPLRIAGFEVTVVEPDESQWRRARERSGEHVYHEVPRQVFDASIAPEGVDVSEVTARRRLTVRRDGTVVVLE